MQALWKTVWKFLKKLKLELPYDPSIPLLGIYPKKMKTLIWKDTCTPMFRAALFSVAKIRKQLKWLWTGEWIKMWHMHIYIHTCTHTYTYTMDCYSAIKKNEFLPFVPMCIDPKNTTLSKISQTEKDKWKWSEVTQSCPTPCDPMDCSLPGSSLHGILQTRVLVWVAISFSGGSSQPRDRTRVSCIPGRCFNLWATREAYEVAKRVRHDLATEQQQY